MHKGHTIGFFAVILLVWHAGCHSMHAQPLSDSATASVVTCGPGDDFYLSFGHSAIRICDPKQDIDYVYNYGTFDFDAPHFYWNFARGMMDYCLSRTCFDYFIETYVYEGRWVCEQRLSLSTQQVNNLFLMLEWNYLPENRYYRYDFFRDNCATRVRDMVEGAMGHSPVAYCEGEAGMSYRSMVHRSACQQWWLMGVDMLLGLRADHRCDVREAMFHPIAMMETFGCSTHTDDGSDMVLSTTRHLEDRRDPLARSFPPLVVFALLFVAVALLTWKRLWPAWADRVLFVVAGLVGLFLCFMWFGTDHWCTRWNLNILWASPLLLLIALRHRRSPRWALWFQEACFAVAAVWVVVCGLSAAILPIVLTLALRVACLIPRKPRLRRQPR